MLNLIRENNTGPFENSTVEHIQGDLKAGLELMEDDHQQALLALVKRNQIQKLYARVTII